MAPSETDDLLAEMAIHQRLIGGNGKNGTNGDNSVHGGNGAKENNCANGNNGATENNIANGDNSANSNDHTITTTTTSVANGAIGDNGTIVPKQ